MSLYYQFKLSMDKSHKSQVNQINKIFIAPFLFCISLPFLFIVYNLIKSEYNEYFVYGQLKNGKIVNFYRENNSTEGPPSEHFHCKIVVEKKILDYTIQNSNQSFAISKEDELLIENLSIGDSVKVKILNEKQVKILEWRKKIINKKNNFWNILFIWILISILTIIPITLFIKIYKIYKQ